jgi:hypothetical protein
MTSMTSSGRRMNRWYVSSCVKIAASARAMSSSFWCWK